jgi:hypothetical protein
MSKRQQDNKVSKRRQTFDLSHAPQVPARFNRSLERKRHKPEPTDKLLDLGSVH